MVDRCRYCDSKVYTAEGMDKVWECNTCKKGLTNEEVVVKHK